MTNHNGNHKTNKIFPQLRRIYIVGIRQRIKERIPNINPLIFVFQAMRMTRGIKSQKISIPENKSFQCASWPQRSRPRSEFAVPKNIFLLHHNRPNASCSLLHIKLNVSLSIRISYEVPIKAAVNMIREENKQAIREFKCGWKLYQKLMNGIKKLNENWTPFIASDIEVESMPTAILEFMTEGAPVLFNKCRKALEGTVEGIQ